MQPSRPPPVHDLSVPHDSTIALFAVAAAPDPLVRPYRVRNHNLVGLSVGE